MDILFASNKLKKQLNEEKAMIKAHGNERARKLKIIMAQLRAAPSLAIFSPPYSPPHRCHELKGKRKNQLSLDLDGPYRLIIKPTHNPLPQKALGGLDWEQVTMIEIQSIENTHD